MNKPTAAVTSTAYSNKNSKSNTNNNTNNNSHQPWRYRYFQKDKLRVQERYWHPLHELPFPCSTNNNNNNKTCLVIPDGRTWRRYLPLWTELIQQQQQQQQQQQSSSSLLQWILLESAVELMDWRNSSPCMPQQQQQFVVDNNDNGSHDSLMMREATAPRERSKILHLLEQSTQQQQQQEQQLPSIATFCDLSVRDDDEDEGCDEWDFLDFASMSVVDRSRHALIRAGRMMLTSNMDDQNSSKVLLVLLLLLVHDENERQILQELYEREDDSDNGMMRIVTVDEFLQYMAEHNLLQSAGATDDQSTTATSLPKWKALQRRCDEEYKRRNTVPNSTTTDDDDDDDDADNCQQEYLTNDQVQEGLRRGELMRGRLEVTQQNPKEAFVQIVSAGSNASTSYFINQRKDHFNRALHGDVVVLKRLPESQWGRPIGKRRLIVNVNNADKDDDDDDDDVNNDNDEDNTEEDIPPVPSARVVAIASRSSRSHCVATLVDVPRSDESHVLVVPMDIRFPKIRIASKAWKKYLHQRLLVAIDQWDVGSAYPSGRCDEILGPIGDLEVEIKCLLLENQIHLDPFSAAALASLPSEGHQWVVPEKEISQRRDLRHSRRIFSVDPPGCQDIDDTFHAYVLPNGDIEVGVHIADVTFFVAHNSPLDKEAQKRGTTFYLVDRRFDMLPSLLSSDLCSLHGGVDRLAVSVIWTLSPDFETVKSVWYGRTVIQNCQAMTYDQAHNILHDTPPDEPGKSVPPLTAGYPVDRSRIAELKKDLLILRDLGRKLKKTREEVGGAVDLSSGDLGGELKFSLDENGDPIAVKPKQELEIHNTVAELMIYANGYVATKIYDTFKDSALLRIHRTVEQSRFDGLKQILNVGGISLEGSSNSNLAKTLKKVEQAGAVVNSLIKSLATRAMSEAQYICTGNQQDGLDLSHYGLGVDRYTHFTSPIRRYADVVVHKQLLASLYMEKLPQAASATLNAFVEPDRPALPAIPDSNVISTMAGEGIDGDTPAGDNDMIGDDLNGDDFLDSLIEGASELALGGFGDEGSGGYDKEGDDHDVADQASKLPGSAVGITTTSSRIKPYEGFEVARIASSLNHQNRMAKHSSMQCQNLFLSLYFRNHEEVAQGVVTELRVNGFFVYIPKFDISGPVYVRDINGDVQMDPSLFGLPATAGQPATLAFAASSSCRRFPSGQCTLVESSHGSVEGARLEISVPESPMKFVVRTVDVVSILLRCDDWDVRSRVPPPRFLLVSKSTRPPPGFGYKESPATTKITSKTIQRKERAGAVESALNEHESNVGATPSKKAAFSSIFDALQSIHVPPVLEGVPVRSRASAKANKNCDDDHRQEVFGGRIVYRKFVNPDTKSATQEAAISAASEAAAQRRANAVQTMERRNEYDTTRQVERTVMARTQRLAADKRNTRKSNAK